MHVHFVGEGDDGQSVSSHHARALAVAGVEVSFDGASHPTSPFDIVHLRIDAPSDWRLLRRLATWRLGGTAILRYWSGRDVFWAEHHAASRRFAHALTRMGAVQLARSEDLVKRLARLAVAAQAGPMLSLHVYNTCEPEPLPPIFTLLCHLPTSRREFSGGAWIDELIRRLPSVRFLILGDEGTDYRRSRNVESLGFVADVNRAIQRSTAVVQARVDATPSRLSMEALCHGRHVIATHATPHVQFGGSFEACFQAVRAVEREADFNLEGREYVCREFGRPQGVERLLAALEEAAQVGAWAGLARGPRGALLALCDPAVLGAGRIRMPSLIEVPEDADVFRSLLSGAGRATNAGLGVEEART